MDNIAEKQLIGVEQPIVLRKIYFGVVCAFTLFIVLLILNLNNYKTWFAIPMGALLVAYYFAIMLNTVNVYKCNESIMVEHPIKGEFVFDKCELINVKTVLLFNKLCFPHNAFYFSYSTGRKVLWSMFDESKIEREIRQLLLE